MWPRCKEKNADGLERMAKRLRHDMRREDVDELEEKDIHYIELTGKQKANLDGGHGAEGVSASSKSDKMDEKNYK